jgi:hypothetical protein
VGMALKAAIAAPEGELKLLNWFANGEPDEFAGKIGRLERHLETINRFLDMLRKVRPQDFS